MELKKCKLGDVCDIFGRIGFRGYTVQDLVESPKDGAIALSPSNIVNGEIDLQKVTYISWFKYEESPEIKVNKDDIVLVKTGSSVGKTALVRDVVHPITLNPQFVVLKNLSVNPVYLSYILKGKNFQDSLWAITVGSTVPTLSQKNLAEIPISILPIEIQKKIASVLSALDDKIALNKKMNQKLEAMAKRLYDYWFVQYDFPDKNGHPYKTTGGPMTYNPALKREIPVGWEVKQICDIASFEKESVRPSDNPNIEYKHFSIPGYDECGSYVLETGESILSDKFKVSEIDILVSKLNPWTSRVIWGESQEHQICSTEFVVMKLHELKEKGFLYSLVKQPSFIDYCTRGSSGTSHSHRRVNPEYMMDYIFAYEKDAVQSFSAIVSRYALMMMKNLRENRRLTALRDKLLPLLMNGQVVVG